MIIYELDPRKKEIRVRVSGKTTGFIRSCFGGYRYEIDKKNFGPTFETVAQVKRDIESAA
jgi:hypothetical protein